MNISISGEESIAVETAAPEMSARDYILSKVNANGREENEDPFYVCDLGRLVDLYDLWGCAMSGIHPFYAVKCNNDPALLKTLAALGAGFDCASRTELQSVLGLGVPAERIIYANPCKQRSHLKFAARHGVRLMTFDNKMELHKVKTHFPSARLVLRIRADDPTAVCQLGAKFGCTVSVGRTLLNTAAQLQLSVVGVSFHVGSGSQTPSSYTVAMEMAAEMFRHAAGLGYHMTLLDIGGGFPGDQQSNQLFAEVASAVKRGITAHFSDCHDLEIIAEPGRFFACSTHALAVNIISKRVSTEMTSDPSEDSSVMYYVNDGVYGSFNCILFDHVTPTPAPLRAPLSSARLSPSSVWGPTCDGLDKLCDQALLPDLAIGEWIWFQDMGAYTVSAASSFNGFLRPMTHHYISTDKSAKLSELLNTCDARGKSLLPMEADVVEAAPPAPAVTMEIVAMDTPVVAPVTSPPPMLQGMVQVY